MIVDSKKINLLFLNFPTINSVLIPFHHLNKAPLEIRLGYSKVPWWMKKERTNTTSMVFNYLILKRFKSTTS